MDPLRTSLIVVGIAILIAVYLWGARRRRRLRSRHFPLRTVRSGAGISGSGSASAAQTPNSGAREAVGAADRHPGESLSADEARELEALDSLIQERASEPATLELDLRHVPEETGGARSKDSKAQVRRTPRPKQQQLIVLHVLAGEGESIAGNALMRGFRDTGFEFGAMGIFHFPAKGSPGQDALFSVANMLEPGRFDPDAMDTFATPGVVLFMQLSAVRDPVAAFEQMLSAGRALAAALHGRLCDDRRSVLTTRVIEDIRSRVESYQSEVTAKH